MILWCDGTADAVAHMARDAELLAAAEAGQPPVLRLYRFAPPGITLGRAQRPELELDLERCTREGVRWAVRPTGGRAIYHDQEWTFALASPIDDPAWGGSLEHSYDALGQLVLRSLLRLGVPAAVTRGVPGRAAGAAASEVAPGCFASTARHELVLGGRKLAGIAQRRTRRALLQQGSLLLGDAHLRLADYLRMDAAAREVQRGALARAAAPAGAWLGVDTPLERWADALRAELPAGTRQVNGDAGVFLLTPEKSASYTASAP